ECLARGGVQVEGWQVLAIGGVEHTVRQREPAWCRAEELAGLQLEADATVEEVVVVRRHERTAAAFAILSEPEIEQFSRVAIEASRHRAAAGYEQPVAGDNEGALRGDAAEGVGVVRLLDIEGAIAVVGPDNSARAGVQRVQEDAHERPDA